MSQIAGRNLQCQVPYDSRIRCLVFTGDYLGNIWSGIDTGINMNRIHRITMIVDWRDHLIGKRELCGGDKSGSYYFEVGSEGKYGLGLNNYSDFQPTEKDILVWTKEIGDKPTLQVNGMYATVDTLLRDPVGTFRIPVELSFPVNMKVFSLKLEDYDHNVLLDAFPVQFINDGDVEFGLYDTVNGQILKNIGNVPLTAVF